MKLVSALAVCLLIYACQPFENSVRDGIGAANGYVNKALQQYPQCAVKGSTGTQCAIIHKGADSINVAVDALELYCASPSFADGTGSCSPPTNKADKNQAVNKLRAALTSMNRNIADVKFLAGVKP